MNEIIVIIESPLFGIIWIGCTLLVTYLGIQKGYPILGFING